ncbi:hypothetical protein [Pyrobaculum sp.]|uniref:hypothetical protein n=1 Tax=Pyrobaculum sp. TaxID=2004705 RepID=UPI00315EA015
MHRLVDNGSASSRSQWRSSRVIALGFVLAFVVLISFALSYRGVELMYAGDGLVVYAQQASPGSEELQIVVKKGGKALEHASFVFAPGESGFVALGNGSDAKPVPLGKFIAEGQRLLNRLGFRGVKNYDVELGIVVFTQVMNVTDKGGKKVLEVYTDVFAVPLSPEKIRGKRVVVEKEFRPMYKTEQPIEESSQTASVMARTPPEKMTVCPDPRFPKQIKYCYFGSAYSYCYYWALDSTLSSTNIYAPLNAIYLDNTDGGKIDRAHITTYLQLKSDWANRLEFNYGIGIGNTRASLGAGISFVLSSGSTQVKFLDVSCNAYNYRYSQRTPNCYDRIRLSYSYPQWFFDDAVIYLGIWGELRVVKWVYVYAFNSGFDCRIENKDVAYGLVFYPYGDSQYNGAFRPYLIVDDTPFSMAETRSIKAVIDKFGWQSLPYSTQKSNDMSILQADLVTKSSSWGMSLASIPLVYYANERFGLSLDIGIPLTVRISSDYNEVVLSVGFYEISSPSQYTWYPAMVKVGTVDAFLRPDSSATVNGTWVAVQLLKPNPR